jgi:hypothetical protein
MQTGRTGRTEQILVKRSEKVGKGVVLFAGLIILRLRLFINRYAGKSMVIAGCGSKVKQESALKAEMIIRVKGLHPLSG